MTYRLFTCVLALSGQGRAKRERIFLRRRQDSFGYRGLCLQQPRRWPGLLALHWLFRDIAKSRQLSARRKIRCYGQESRGLLPSCRKEDAGRWGSTECSAAAIS